MNAYKTWYRIPLMGLAMAALLAGMWAGLVRIGWGWPALQPALPLGHGPLMVSGFFGTLIGLERAVAYRRAWGYLAPLFCAAGGVAVGLGRSVAAIGDGGLVGPLLMTLGSAVMVLIFIAVLRQQMAGYSLVMSFGAGCWLVGNVLWLTGRPVFQIVLWWVAFLVITIAGERLEMSRMLRLRPAVRGLFALALGVFALGLAATLFAYPLGVRLAGAGMAGIGLWLARYDIARKTVRQAGLTRFIAISLLSGFGWLMAGGLIAAIYGGVPAGPRYDAMLHSVLVGFVFAMVFGHAPIIFPAVLRIPVTYRPVLYLPLALLHLSLVGRVLGGLALWQPVRMWSGLLNALAILIFLGLMIPLGRRAAAGEKTGAGGERVFAGGKIGRGGSVRANPPRQPEPSPAHGETPAQAKTHPGAG